MESSRQIREMILGLKQQGTTVFLTTHYIEEAERLCDRIAFIAAGQIVASGTVSELMDSISYNHTVHFATDKIAESEDVVLELQNRFKDSKVELRPDNSLLMISEERIPLLPLMKFLKDRGIEVYEARELRPSLEDVFVELTGIESSILKTEIREGADEKWDCIWNILKKDIKNYYLKPRISAGELYFLFLTLYNLSVLGRKDIRCFPA